MSPRRLYVLGLALIACGTPPPRRGPARATAMPGAATASPAPVSPSIPPPPAAPVIVDDGPRPAIVPQIWDGVTALAFTPDGRELIAASARGLYAFDIESGLLRARLAGGDDSSGPIFASDARVYRNGKWTGILVHDRTTGARDEAALGPAFGELTKILGRTPGGALVASTYHGVGVYAGEPLAKVRERAIQLWPSTVTSADGTLIASEEVDLTGKSLKPLPLHLWRVADLAPVRTLRCAPDTSSHIAVSAGGAYIACESRAGTVITRASGSVAVVPLGGAMAFHPTRPLLAFASGYVVDASKPARPPVRLDPHRLASDAYDYGAAAIAWSADGAQFAIGRRSGEIDIFDPTGAHLRSFTSRGARVHAIERAAPGVLVIGEGERLRTWDAATGISRPIEDGWLHSHFAATPDGRTRAVFPP